MGEYLKIPEVARRLDVSEKTARRYIRSGELPSVFIGGAYRVSEEDLIGYQKGAIVKPEERTEPPKDRRRSLEEFLQEDVGHALLATLSREELRKGAREEGREFRDACGDEYDAVIALRKETGHSMEGPISLFSSGETQLDVFRKYTAVTFAERGEEEAAAEEARMAATVA